MLYQSHQQVAVRFLLVARVQTPEQAVYNLAQGLELNQRQVGGHLDLKVAVQA